MNASCYRKIMMTQTTIRRTFKYKLYQCGKKDKHLHQQINIAGLIWNHCVALHKRYYRLFGHHLSEPKLKKHISKLRMKTEKFAYWKLLGSQAVQEIVERLEKAYQRFFAGKGGIPRFKKVKKFKSFTLKQTAGWKLLPDENAKRGQLQIGKRCYKFVKHRPLSGEIKTVTIKRDNCGQLWVCFSVVDELAITEKVGTGEIGGFDFGLRTFLIDHTNASYEAPQYLRGSLKRIQRLNKAVSRKVKGSHNRKKAVWQLSRTHIRISDKRRDFHYKLAHDLCDQYDVLVFEDLNIDGMKRLWGRKVSDLGFAQFIQIVEWIATKRGKTVIKIDRFTPTTQMCSNCGHRQTMRLQDRLFVCQNCGMSRHRDHNAAINIQQAGASAYTERGLCKTS